MDRDEWLSIGVVTKLEHFDNQFLKNFFVKPRNYKDGQWVNLEEGNYEYTPEDFYMLDIDKNEVVEKPHLQKMASIISPNKEWDKYLNIQNDE